MADQTLDTTGLSCPLPILKAKKALAALSTGATLEIIATDPGAEEDFDAFCRTTGHALVETSKTGGVYRFVIRKQA